MDERLDQALLAAVADARPDWQIVMVGPVVKIDPATLPQRPNIHYLGQKSYWALPAYLAGWDVALLPFALNDATRFISPTKTPEYLAAGCPVVSTPIKDVVHTYGDLDAVRIAAGPEAFVAEAERARRWPCGRTDILGVNFYSDNQWMTSGRTIGMGHDLYRPLRDLLRDVAARYGRPIVISETGAEGRNGPGWLRYVAGEVRAARRQGIRVEGICLYPVMDYPGWQNGRHCRCGLLETDAKWETRQIDRELLAQLNEERLLLRETQPDRAEA